MNIGLLWILVFRFLLLLAKAYRGRPGYKTIWILFFLINCSRNGTRLILKVYSTTLIEAIVTDIGEAKFAAVLVQAMGWLVELNSRRRPITLRSTLRFSSFTTF